MVRRECVGRRGVAPTGRRPGWAWLGDRSAVGDGAGKAGWRGRAGPATRGVGLTARRRGGHEPLSGSGRPRRGGPDNGGAVQRPAARPPASLAGARASRDRAPPLQGSALHPVQGPERPAAASPLPRGAYAAGPHGDPGDERGRGAVARDAGRAPVSGSAPAPRRLIVGISGASGVVYGIRLLQILRAHPDIESHLVCSKAAERTIAEETDWAVKDVKAMASVVHPVTDIGASIASGSFRTDGIDHTCGRVLDLFATSHDLARRWGESDPQPGDREPS